MSSTTTDPAEIRLEKVATRMGYRLEIEHKNSGDSIRIDPLALEGLSWYEFDVAVDSGSDSEITVYSDGEPISPPHEIRFRNEYALAIVHVKDGSVEVASPKIDHSNRLTAPELEWLSQQDAEIFSEFLENPLGPDSD